MEWFFVNSDDDIVVGDEDEDNGEDDVDIVVGDEDDGEDVDDEDADNIVVGDSTFCSLSIFVFFSCPKMTFAVNTAWSLGLFISFGFKSSNKLYPYTFGL